MPRNGWKSITVTEKVYSYFYEKWEKAKEEKRLTKGQTSFSGFITQLLYQLMEEEKKRSRQ